MVLSEQDESHDMINIGKLNIITNSEETWESSRTIPEEGHLLTIPRFFSHNTKNNC